MKWIVGLPTIHFFYFCAAIGFSAFGSVIKIKNFISGHDALLPFRETALLGREFDTHNNFDSLNNLKKINNEFRKNKRIQVR